jgi:hypothetical protein
MGVPLVHPRLEQNPLPETCTFEISDGHNPEPRSNKNRSRYLIVTERKLFMPLHSQFFHHFNLKHVLTIRASV